jgi:hypothetical protein
LDWVRSLVLPPTQAAGYPITRDENITDICWLSPHRLAVSHLDGRLTTFIIDDNENNQHTTSGRLNDHRSRREASSNSSSSSDIKQDHDIGSLMKMTSSSMIRIESFRVFPTAIRTISPLPISASLRSAATSQITDEKRSLLSDEKQSAEIQQDHRPHLVIGDDVCCSPPSQRWSINLTQWMLVFNRVILVSMI